MPIAHYMRFVAAAGHELGEFDRVGGLPTHLPTEFPTSTEFGTEYRFLMQLLSVERVGLRNCRCLQLYQSAELELGDDPLPSVVVVPWNSPKNQERRGRAWDALPLCRVDWDVRVDPARVPSTSGVTEELVRLLESKIGGVPPLVDPPLLGARFLGQIAEEPCGFNFGGLLLTLWERPDGGVVCLPA